MKIKKTALLICLILFIYFIGGIIYNFTRKEEKEVVDVLDAKTFKNLVELRNALQDKGIDVSSITNVKAAENIAKKNGYNYTVEKIS